VYEIGNGTKFYNLHLPFATPLIKGAICMGDLLSLLLDDEKGSGGHPSLTTITA